MISRKEQINLIGQKKAQTIKEKINIFDIKFLKLPFNRRHHTKLKYNVHAWEKLFATHIINEKLIYNTVYKSYK